MTVEKIVERIVEKPVIIYKKSRRPHGKK
jgi:hypothetical protein